MLEVTLSELESSTLARIHAATSPEQLEPVRIEVLGRKGTLAAISKDMGKLTAEQKASIGKLLNSAKLLALGWKPEVTLSAGLASTYAWYQNTHTA